MGEIFPPLSRREECDVAVVGAGITGAIVTYELLRHGLDVVVIDKRDAGNGSTAASTSLIQYEIDTPLRKLIAMVGRDHAFRAYQLGVEAVDRLREIALELGNACEFAMRPSLYLGRGIREVKGLRDEYLLRKQMGIKLKFLEGDALRRFPFKAAAALYSRHGAEVDCYQLCHDLLKRAEENGARVFDRTNLESLKRTARGFRLFTDREAEIAARHVVFCTGYESRHFIPQEQTGRLRSTYVIASEPIADFSSWPERCLIWETGSPYYYMRTTSDDRILVGGLDDDFRSPERREESVERKSIYLQRHFRSMFPGIPWETYCAWAGTFGETKDGLAYIGEPPSLPGTFFVLGYGGNGITFSMIAAGLAADFVLGHKNPDAAIFRFGR